ncbi:hypothetical protein FB451DRAFT_1460659 [Mycena latifolia]|nr:hypothetical protein FB451DRAFT_1460659 [Mycena latifolia]
MTPPGPQTRAHDEEDVPLAFTQKGFEGLLILERNTASLSDLRRKLQDDVTRERGGNTVWKAVSAKPVQIDVPGIGSYYAERHPADVDRLAQAVLGQQEFLRATNLGQSRTNGSERLYKSFDDFRKDAILCLIGCDGNNKPMSPDNELGIGWAVFNHAQYPKEFLLFGRAEDRLHSGIVGEYGVTSEYFQGGLLSPERWNTFINDCWLLGGIKAGVRFMTVADFASCTREDLTSPNESKLREDIRNDASTIDYSGQGILHFIVTLTAAEAHVLMECGYRSTNHDVYGQLFIPDVDQDAVSLRDSCTLVDLRVHNETMHVTQSISNLSGETTLARSLMGFLKPSSYTNEFQDKHRDYLDRLKVNGVPASSLCNRKIRKTDLAVVSAIEKLSKMDVKSASGRSMLHALSSAVRQTAEPYFAGCGLDRSTSDLLLLAIDRQIAKDIQSGHFDQSFTLSTYNHVQSFIDENNNRVRHDKILTAAHSHIVSVAVEFDKGIFDHRVSGIRLKRKPFEPRDRDTAWNAFKRDLGYHLADLADPDFSDLGYQFVIDFLENYVTIPHVEIKDL